MTDETRKLTHSELRRLKPGDLVAWGKSNWDKKVKQPGSFWEVGQISEIPVRSAPHVQVCLHGLPHEVEKNRLYIVPIIAVEDMHTEYDYNS